MAALYTKCCLSDDVLPSINTSQYDKPLVPLIIHVRQSRARQMGVTVASFFKVAFRATINLKFNFIIMS